MTSPPEKADSTPRNSKRSFAERYEEMMRDRIEGDRPELEWRRKKLRKELHYIRKHWWLFPDWFWYVGLAGGSGCALYFRHYLLALIGGLFVACHAVGHLAYRVGFEQGYIESFTNYDAPFKAEEEEHNGHE